MIARNKLSNFCYNKYYIIFTNVIKFEDFVRFLTILATDPSTVFVVSTTILIYSVLVVEYRVLHLSQAVFCKKL